MIQRRPRSHRRFLSQTLLRLTLRVGVLLLVVPGCGGSPLALDAQPLDANARASADDGTTLASPSTSTRALDPLLESLSRRAVRYFLDCTHPTTGLTLDRARNVRDDDTSPTPRESLAPASRVASLAATGYALAAFGIAERRDWLSHADALESTLRTLRGIVSLPLREHGWFYHFVDWETGARVWRCEVSSIDTALLVAGLVLVAQALEEPEVTRRVDEILANIDWPWMLTDDGARPDELFFSHGWKPESGFLPHRWRSHSEHMVLYLLAYGLFPAMPPGSWDAWARPELLDGEHRVLVGGPLFLHQMTQAYFDFEGRRDRSGLDYFETSRIATLANRRHCIRNPGGFRGYSETIWGLSACDGPDGYRAYGAPGHVVDDGTLAPAAAVASVLFTPEESLAAAHAFRDQYPESFGRYGFASGVNPHREWHARDAIGIDLGQLLLAIEAHRDGLPQRLLASRAELASAMDRVGFVRSIVRGDDTADR